MRKTILFIFLLLALLPATSRAQSPVSYRVRSGAALPTPCLNNAAVVDMFYLRSGVAADDGIYTCNTDHINWDKGGVVLPALSGSGTAGQLAKWTSATVLGNATAGSDYENPLTFSSPLSRSVNTISCSTCGVTSNRIDQNNASTSSAQLRGVLSDENGTGAALFDGATSPSFTTPVLGVASSTSMSVTGTGGAGFLQLLNQSSAPSTPTSAARIFVDNSNRLSWIGTNGFTRTFDGTANTANRIYVLPDAASNFPVYPFTITYAGVTAARTVTYPDANFTVARTDAANTFAGTQVFSTQITVGTMALDNNLRMPSGGSINWSNSGGTAYSYIYNNGDGIIQLGDHLGTGNPRLQFGGTTNSYNAIGRDAVNGFTFQSAAGTATWNDASTAGSATVTDRYLLHIAAPTLTATNSSVTYTNASTVDIEGAPAASTNVTITNTAMALRVRAGKTLLNGTVFIPNITTSSGLQTAVLCQSSGGEMIADSVACLASSARFKNRIKPLNSGLNEILSLRPVSFFYKPEGIFATNQNFQRERVGLIAEEVAKIDPRLVGFEKDNITPRTVGYEQIVPVLIKAVQEQQKQIEELKQQIVDLRSRSTNEQIDYCIDHPRAASGRTYTVRSEVNGKCGRHRARKMRSH